MSIHERIPHTPNNDLRSILGSIEFESLSNDERAEFERRLEDFEAIGLAGLRIAALRRAKAGQVSTPEPVASGAAVPQPQLVETEAPHDLPEATTESHELANPDITFEDGIPPEDQAEILRRLGRDEASDATSQKGSSEENSVKESDDEKNRSSIDGVGQRHGADLEPKDGSHAFTGERSTNRRGRYGAVAAVAALGLLTWGGIEATNDQTNTQVAAEDVDGGQPKSNLELVQLSSDNYAIDADMVLTKDGKTVSRTEPAVEGSEKSTESGATNVSLESKVKLLVTPGQLESALDIDAEKSSVATVDLSRVTPIADFENLQPEVEDINVAHWDSLAKAADTAITEIEVAISETEDEAAKSTYQVELDEAKQHKALVGVIYEDLKNETGIDKEAARELINQFIAKNSLGDALSSDETKKAIEAEVKRAYPDVKKVKLEGDIKQPVVSVEDKEATSKSGWTHQLGVMPDSFKAEVKNG